MANCNTWWYNYWQGYDSSGLYTRHFLHFGNRISLGVKRVSTWFASVVGSPVSERWPDSSFVNISCKCKWHCMLDLIASVVAIAHLHGIAMSTVCVFGGAKWFCGGNFSAEATPAHEPPTRDQKNGEAVKEEFRAGDEINGGLPSRNLQSRVELLSSLISLFIISSHPS